MTKPVTPYIVEEPATESAPMPAPDPFDNLRLDQSFVETAGVKKLLTEVPVHKPHPQDFVRVHPSPDYRQVVAMVELKADREFYVATADIARAMPDEFVRMTLYTTINRQDVVQLWPVRVPPDDGKRKVLKWYTSAADAAQMAMHRWIRLKANMNLGAYEITESSITVEPVWPDLSFRELLRIAFRDGIIDRLDHPVIRRLREGA